MDNAVTQRLTTGCLVIIAGILISVALYLSSRMLIPFVLAVFLVYLVAPLIGIFEKRCRLPHGLAIAATFLVTLVVLVGLGIFVVANFKTVIQSASVYREKSLAAVTYLVGILNQLGISLDAGSISHMIEGLPVFGYVKQAAGVLVSFVSSGTLVLIFMVFLVSGAEVAVPNEGVYSEIAHKIQKYLATKVTTSLVTGVLVGITLALFGIDLAFLLGLLTFLLNFIPTLGSIIATLLPVPLALLKYENPGMVLAVVAVPGAIQFVVGNLIEPKLLGESLGLHPAAILLSLIFWGMLWGVVGMLLAAPLMAVLKIVLIRMEPTRPFAELLGGRLPRG